MRRGTLERQGLGTEKLVYRQEEGLEPVWPRPRGGARTMVGMELGSTELSGIVGGLNLREEGVEFGCFLIAPSPSPRRGVPGRGLPRQLGVRVHGGPRRPQGQPPGQVLGEWAVAPSPPRHAFQGVQD